MTAGRGSRFPGAVRGQGPGTVTTDPASPVALPALVGGPPPHNQEMRNDRRPFGNGEDDQGVPPAQVDDQQGRGRHEDRGGQPGHNDERKQSILPPGIEVGIDGRVRGRRSSHTPAGMAPAR